MTIPPPGAVGAGGGCAVPPARATSGPRPWIANRGEGWVEQWTPEPDTVCISITEPIGPYRRQDEARLPKGFVDVLRMQFQDYDGERIHPKNAVLITPTQAAQIARFARKYRGKNILVHCAAGISRSGAVVEALLEAFPEYEDKGWPRHPNGHVKSLMKRALGLVPLGAEGGEVDAGIAACR